MIIELLMRQAQEQGSGNALLQQPHERSHMRAQAHNALGNRKMRCEKWRRLKLAGEENM